MKSLFTSTVRHGIFDGRMVLQIVTMTTENRFVRFGKLSEPSRDSVSTGLVLNNPKLTKLVTSGLE